VKSKNKKTVAKNMTNQFCNSFFILSLVTGSFRYAKKINLFFNFSFPPTKDQPFLSFDKSDYL